MLHARRRALAEFLRRLTDILLVILFPPSLFKQAGHTIRADHDQVLRFVAEGVTTTGDKVTQTPKPLSSAIIGSSKQLTNQDMLCQVQLQLPA
jgi:hypothetical protein